MFPIIGLVVVFGIIFGGFLLEGGHFEVIVEAAPMEFVMIFGSAVGAQFVSQDLAWPEENGRRRDERHCRPKMG